jgi:hypothetical protein
MTTCLLRDSIILQINKVSHRSESSFRSQQWPKECSEIYGNRKFITLFIRTRHWSLIWARRTNPTIYYSLTFHFYFIVNDGETKETTAVARLQIFNKQQLTATIKKSQFNSNNEERCFLSVPCEGVIKGTSLKFSSEPVWKRGRIPPPWPCES